MISAPSPLLGHAEAQQTLAHAWREERLHHAWLLTGPAGIGKATLAHQFANTVLNGVTLEDKLVRKGAHPDLLVITRAIDEARAGSRRSDMVMDDVRPISGFLHRTATTGGWRVVVVEGVDRMNQHAANAMLKLIEEPPSKVLLLLTSDSPARLLPTLRSRCRRLRLSTLDSRTMDAVLLQQLPNATPAERQTLIDLSGGSPGRALALAADDGVALSRIVQQALGHSGQVSDLWSYELADAILRHDNGFSTFLELLCSAISEMIRGQARGFPKEGSTVLDRGANPLRWAEIYPDLTRLSDEAERFNLDKRQALLTSLSLLSGS